MASDNNQSDIHFDKNRATPATGPIPNVSPVFNGPVGNHEEHDKIEGGFTITGRKKNKE